MQKIKIYSLGAVCLLSLLFDWWLINLALYSGRPLTFWLWPILLSLVWAAVLSLFSLANYQKWLFQALIAGGLIAYLAVFPSDKFVWLGGMLFFILVYLFEHRIKSLGKNQSHFSIRHLVGSSIIILSYAFLLLLGFNIYHNTSEDFKRNPEQFYNRLGESTAKSFRASGRLGEQFNFNQSLDEFLVKQAAEEDRGNFDLTATREELLRRFGINASGSETLAEIFARAATDQVKDIASKYERVFPLIFTVVVMALLRTFAFLFNWLAIFVSWLLFKILLAVKFFRISKVTVEVDKLEI
ncbi:MAG: hypothetical protein HYV13_02765 [Candidatus Doudnabacteria bacterium]|nr:hypothetical protein [Candidatus Doudnabacteria bacterium]